jgi:transposase
MSITGLGRVDVKKTDDSIRRKIVELYTKDKLSIVTLRDRFGISKETIKRILSEYKAEVT